MKVSCGDGLLKLTHDFIERQAVVPDSGGVGLVFLKQVG
jgi:hypothetical protein